MDAGASPSTARDLPVAVCVPEPLGHDLRAWVEGELGWQVVPAGGPPRPVLTLREVGDVRPGCVVVTAAEVDAHTLRRAFDAGARDVLGWPADRDRLLDMARQPVSPEVGGPPTWCVAGTGGGVGTSTVTLAVAGLAAWGGRSVVVVGGDGLLQLCGVGRWSGPGLAEVRALGPAEVAAEVATLARPIAGVDRLRVLGGSGGPAPPRSVDATGWPADLAVIDGGALTEAAPGDTPDGRVDLLVTAPDVRAAGAEGIDAPLLVVGEGPLDRRGVRTLAGRREVGWLPSSARVARAALQGRVPAGLPGSWMRQLRGALVGATQR